MTTPPPPTLPDPLRHTIAGQLEQVAVDAEELGTALALDDAVIVGHIEQLQHIDRIAQIVRGLADVIGSQQPVEAIQNVTLADLKEALGAALNGSQTAPTSLTIAHN